MAGLLETNPVTLLNALTSSRIIPGDVIVLLDGIYRNDYLASIKGIEGNPIIIRPKNQGKVIINGSLKFTETNPYVEIYDLNITDTREDRHIITNSLYFSGAGLGLFGCYIKDLHSSGISWFGSGAGEVSENIVLNNGYLDTDESGHGHGIYTHNDLGGARKIARNLFANQLGTYAIQIYSAGKNHIKDFLVEDNIINGDSVTTGGGLGLTDFVYQRNIQYKDYCQQGRYSGDNQNENGQIIDNIFFDLLSYTVNQNVTPEWLNLTESGNVVYGGEPSNRSGYTVIAQPETWIKLIPFTKSNRWVASLTIFNRDSLEIVSVDFTGIEDGNYILRNMQNYDETFSFSWDGTNFVNVEMSFTGENTPIFTAFVVEKA
jgi:hypothetical protein